MHQKFIGATLLAVLSSAGHAQTNVTMYGSIDAGLRNLSNVNAGGDSRLTMGSNGTFRSNRLGFRGVEDLGGGLKANFALELGFNTATGALNNTTNTLFQREARVGLSGDFGEVSLGRQYTVAYRTVLAFDPFRFRYPSITYALSSTAGIRANNDVQYMRRIGGLTVRAEYALGEAAGSSSQGSIQALGAAYSGGPFKAAASYTRGQQNAGTTAAPSFQDYDHMAIGGAWDFGKLTVSGGYVDEKQATTARDITSTWTMAGVSYEFSPQFDLTAGWYRIDVFNTRATAAVGAGAGKKDMIMLGATYNLSKRTTLYAELDRASLDGAYATGGTTRLNQTRQNGLSFGMMHTF